MRIKNINNLVVKRIENIIGEKFSVIIGDADGVDSSIQQILANKSYKNVTVYCSGSYPRNNIGKWETHSVHSDHSPNTRAFFAAKDIAMAKKCDYGLMVWDSKSTGTLSNVYELLLLKKTSVVFVNKTKNFVTVSNPVGFEQLVSNMSDSAFEKANQKIKLKEKIIKIKNKQLSLFPKANNSINADGKNVGGADAV